MRVLSKLFSCFKYILISNVQMHESLCRSLRIFVRETCSREKFSRTEISRNVAVTSEYLDVTTIKRASSIAIAAQSQR